MPDEAPRRALAGPRLAVRFGVALGAMLALLFLLLGLWNVTTQRDHMVRLTAQAADRCAGLVRGATREAMLRVEMDRVDEILGSLGRLPGISRIRLADRKGVIKSSTMPGEVGRVLPATDFTCQVCHVSEPPLNSPPREERVRQIETTEGRLLEVVAPIYNEPSCSAAACHAHPPEQRVLGVIDIRMPLAPVESLITASEEQMGVGVLVGIAALLGLVFYLTWRMVSRPLANLTAATEAVGRGDLTVRVPVTSGDELGRMGETWNATVEELQKARKKLTAHGRLLEDRVREATRDLESAHERMLVVEKMAALGKLAAIVAHEINNPLAGLATYARVLRRQQEKLGEGDRLAEEHLRALELMETEAKRCGTIVRNLLLFSRAPGARFAVTDLRPIAERCVMLAHHKAELQEVTIERACAPDVPEIDCDAGQVQQVMLALVMNGIEAMPEGGTLRIGLRPDAETGGVILEVEDEGCGIAPEAMPHVYEPFFTTKPEGEGVGLGLSVVYGIVERHHGSIQYLSEVGRGTVARVRLPRRQPDSAETEEGEAS